MFEGLKGKKYDHTLKWIAEQEPRGFFKWLMGEMGREDFELKVSNLSKELAPAPRQVDLVWQMLSPKGTAALLHIELQLEPDEGGPRMLEYGMRLYERDHLPVLSVVIFLRCTSNLPAPPFAIDLDGGRTLPATTIWSSGSGGAASTNSGKTVSSVLALAGLMAGTTGESKLQMSVTLA